MLGRYFQHAEESFAIRRPPVGYDRHVYRSGPQPTRLAVAALSHTGYKRKGNLDGYLVTDFERCLARDPVPFFGDISATSGVAIALLSGHLLDWSRDPSHVERAVAAGFKMSRIAGDVLLDQLVGQPPARSDSGLRTRLLEVLGVAARAIYGAAPDRRFIDTAASTTLSVIQGDRIELAQAGDIRALHVRGTYRARLHLGETFEGALAGSAYPGGAPGNPVARALGAPVPLEPAVVCTALRPGDTLVLCSRGLAMLDDGALVTLVNHHPHPAEACKALLDAGLPARGEHNLTAVVVRAIDTAIEGGRGRR